MSTKCDIVAALAGNPNVGKSTLFNTLTGATARVGNWPGVTVELKQGETTHKGKKICVVDLPGIYGLSATSEEEVIAREFIVKGKPDVIIALIDGTAPERTLSLPIQILELTPRVIVAVTKIDETHKMGIHLNLEKLSKELGVAVVGVSALTGQGIKELLDAIVSRRKERQEPLRIEYGGLEPIISELEELLRKEGALREYPPRWVAVKLLEGDAVLLKELKKENPELAERVEELRRSAERLIGEDPSVYIISKRFEYVDSVARKFVVRMRVRTDHSWLERVLSSPVFGPITSVAIIFGIFLAVFAINTGFPLNVIFEMAGAPELAEAIEAWSISGMLEEGFSWLADQVRAALSTHPAWLQSLVADGIIAGVGSVLVFLPLILLVFVALAMLEDSGIAPRMAVVFHEGLKRFGLSGKGVCPLVISLGCNVPGVMAGRASTDEVEKLSLVFSVPFIPCQARLVVTLAFAYAISDNPLTQAGVVLYTYLIGFTAALITAKLVRRHLAGGEAPELILEIPPIHKPKAKVVWWLSWENTKHFLRKAGIIILGLSIVVWALTSFGPSGYVPDQPAESWASDLGMVFEPLLRVYGLNQTQSWITGVSLVMGLAAKEVVLGTITMLYGKEVDPVAAIRSLGFTFPQAMALLTFITLYMPCVATVAVIYQETRSIKWTLLYIAYSLALAFAASLVAFAVFSLF